MTDHLPPPPPANHPRRTVALREVLETPNLGDAGAVRFDRATEVGARVTPGTLFAALPGTRTHGAAFVGEAVERGAGVILCDRPLPGCPAPVAVVPDGARAAFGRVCHAVHGRPSDRLNLLGVTGTNGKTTVAWLVRAILSPPPPPQADDSSSPCVAAGLCGTIETDDGRNRRPSALTTPAGEDLHAWLARCVAHGCGAAAVELSSHALAQHRAAGLTLRNAAVTNVTRDHLDFHGSRQALRAAKAKIADLTADTLYLNADDPGARGLLPPSRTVRTFGTARDADVRATDVRCDAAGSSFTLRRAGREPLRVRTPLLGRFNVSNALAAAALCDWVPDERLVAGLANVAPVPGRLEPIDRGQPFRVLVDYAHTPDGLRAVLEAVRPVCEGRLYLVVGAGGDRDRGKRPAMGAAAGAADGTLFTSDNPRGEEPGAILRALAAGHPDPGRYALAPDRRDAIGLALGVAEPGDWVLVCGKGHEATQEVAGVHHPFDDRAVCRELLAGLGFGGAG